MTYRLIATLVFFFAFSSLSAAEDPGVDVEKSQRLAEQKLKLVEMLVNSPKAQAASESGDAETVALITHGRELLDQARQALASQHYDAAAKALDEALKNVSKANSRSSGGLSDSVQKQRLQEMTEQVDTYRASLSELGKTKGNAAGVQATLQQVDALVAESRKLAAAGHLGEANKKMAEAYQLETGEISRLRAGQEVVLALKFDTPADEYAYEQKRFQSNEILVNMMINEGRAEGERRQMVDNFLKEAAKLKEEAAGFAQSKNHKEAVTAMEKAIGWLNRALQSMGVPVF